MPSITKALYSFIDKAAKREQRFKEDLDHIVAEIPISVDYRYLGLDRSVQFTATKSETDHTLIDVFYAREFIEDFIDRSNYSGFAEILCRDLRRKAMQKDNETAFKKIKTRIPAHTHYSSSTCEGCGAPVQPDQVRCLYCRRPYVSNSPEVLRHYSIRDGIKVCDAEVIVTTTG